MSISIKNLTKVYGTQRAIDGISFDIQKGEIVGFLGPNGAGKSTTMKILTGYLEATEGEAMVNDYSLSTQAKLAQASIGYLPEHNPLYLEMYIREFLEFAGSLYNMKGKALKDRVAELIDMVGLDREKHKKIGQLSKGYRQRVGLAQALIHDPEILILDEPTTGLDPNQLSEIRNLIKTVGKDKTVIFSTHIMQEVDSICERVIVLNQGKIVADESIAAFKAMGESMEATFQKLTQS
ncbi:ATP-binding cassette domain-containing protein [Arcticibacterium luteifluviistationis]|uniref:Multidrug ABC transporter ATP-binding protein n=1 Tax=Arcticibacterium luteifluviistationis TaxID=1784714 RepID=A0A2Z4GEP2_9BACT|nr:ATP-binding cassette domain-containing protein [Arcticibacterium luteifluviistationis]AWV99650.1 multidrug ABC transporter ATP-binding protein [Arcticibacterium luteifluviistationis]